MALPVENSFLVNHYRDIIHYGCNRLVFINSYRLIHRPKTTTIVSLIDWC